MLTRLAFLSSAPFGAPAEPLAGQLRAAIWHDLEVNALIGNGNWAGSLWYNAGSDAPKAADLHIQDLSCNSRYEGHHCSFTLFRDGGVATVLGEKAPDKLRCDATVVQAEDKSGWAVKHIPPRRAGHSRTTMRCKPTAAYANGSFGSIVAAMGGKRTCRSAGIRQLHGANRRYVQSVRDSGVPFLAVRLSLGDMKMVSASS